MIKNITITSNSYFEYISRKLLTNYKINAHMLGNCYYVFQIIMIIVVKYIQNNYKFTQFKHLT